MKRFLTNVADAVKPAANIFKAAFNTAPVAPPVASLLKRKNSSDPATVAPLKKIKIDTSPPSPPPPPTVATKRNMRSIAVDDTPQSLSSSEDSEDTKRRKYISDDEKQQIALKENFLKEYEDEAAAKEVFLKKEEKLLEQLEKKPHTDEANFSEISKVNPDIDIDKRRKVATMIAKKLLPIKGDDKSDEPSSISLFQGYSLEQIVDFFLKQIPPDAISVLDDFEKLSLSSKSREEILDFIILKYKAVRLNAPNTVDGPAHDVYNQLGIKSLPLDDSGSTAGMKSSARALLVCKVESCASDASDWCCCIGSDRLNKFSDIAELIKSQYLPFVTAHPHIQSMMKICGSTSTVPSAGIDNDRAGIDNDPQGFAEPFPSVIIGEQKIVYSIGPILDAESVLGRALIMIRIHNYKTKYYPNGIYFWVYPSFSEGGPSRVFLTIGNGQFMKGPDYTLTTFILDLLQVHINSYYTKHFVDKQGAFSPTILDNQQRVVCFFGGMIHLQTLWVHDLIEGRGLNMSENPISPVPATFNRHCYKFVRSLPMQKWLSDGIPNVKMSYGYKPDSGHLERRIPLTTPIPLVEEFLKQNKEHPDDKTTTHSFPLSCCLTTIFHKYTGSNTDSEDVNDFFDLFQRWPDTKFVQGCSIVHGVSPVVCVVAGTSSNLAGMKYNTLLKYLVPMEFVKKIESLRLVTPIVTHEPGNTFTMVPRTGRNTILVRESIQGGARDVTETCLMEVDLGPAAEKILQLTKNSTIDHDKRALIIFDTLPSALQNTIIMIFREVFRNKEQPRAQLLPEELKKDHPHAQSLFEQLEKDHPHTQLLPEEIEKVQLCFKFFLGLEDSIDFIEFNDLLKGIIIPSISTDGKYIIIKDSPLYRLIRTLDSGMYRHLLMSSMLDEYTGMTSYPLDIPSNFYQHLKPRVRCAFLNSDGQYVELPGGYGEGSLGNCDFSGIFIHSLFQPYIFSATRNSMTFPDETLKKYILYPKGVNAYEAQKNATIPVKVHNKMFLVRLIFYTTKGAIQIVVCVSSTICVASPVGENEENPYCPFGVDVQFNVVSIGPLRVDEGGSMSTDATILATMCDYLSLGCMGAAKKGEYSKTAGYQQFLDYFDDYFRTIMTECFTYVSAYMSPFNSGKDLIMKHFGRVFKDFGDNDISDAIRQKWDWFTYLQKVQPKVCTKVAGNRLLTRAMLEEAITSGRRNMQVVVQTLFDPILGQLDKNAVNEETGDVESEQETPSSSPSPSPSPSVVSSLDSDSLQSTTLAQRVLGEDSLSSQDTSTDWKESMIREHSHSPSLSPMPINVQGPPKNTKKIDSGDIGEGGSTRRRTNKNKKMRKYIGNHKNKTKSKTKMNTIRRIINGNMRTRIRRRKNTNVSRTKTKTKTMKIKRRKFPKRIYLYSSPRKAQKKAYKYLGKTAKLYPASNPAKKYMIYDPKNNKWVNFGQMGYEDYTKHNNKTRRKNYLTRTKGMLGDWKNNKYSANNLSRRILW